MKLQRYIEPGGAPIGWTHWCPGCGQGHIFNVEKPTRAWPEYNIAGGVKWTFDGDMDEPTFSPSMKIQSGGWKDPEDGRQIPLVTHCHYILTKGQIQFCADSTHKLSGKTVPLPEFPEGA